MVWTATMAVGAQADERFRPNSKCSLSSLLHEDHIVSC
jgi:hypothetical protein